MKKKTFLCGFCGKRHPYSELGQYHTKSAWIANGKPRGRKPAEDRWN